LSDERNDCFSFLGKPFQKTHENFEELVKMGIPEFGFEELH
jgi:hypothetical protein